LHTHGLPSSIIFTDGLLHDALAGALKKAGVTCRHMPGHPKIQEMTKSFFEHLGGGMPSLDEVLDEESDSATVPAPEDLTGWKQADRRLVERFADHLANGDRPRSVRAIKRYFNQGDLEYFFNEHERQGVVMAYSSWCMLDYRPTKSSMTQAQIMLAAGLPRAQELMLRARMESHPTVYRVAGHDPQAGTVDMEDVLVGGRVTIHDQLLSENIDNGLFLVARAFSAGQFRFMEPAGPPLGMGMGMEAVGFLRDCGLTFTPDGLKREAHKLGWLWDWAGQQEAERQPPRLCNTDGDDMLFHTASFSVADSAAVRKALLKRKDIDHDEQADELVWCKPNDKASGLLGDTITLGRIELIADELVLTVNSAERFARARQWLTRLPGVRFIDVTTRDMDPSDTARPLDEQMEDNKPFEITPEMTAALQEQLTGHYIAWIDMPLPALGGKTPRQVCRTPAGREQVTMMIRTMPDPIGDVPVHIPREAMLRALGLLTAPPTLLSPNGSMDAMFATPPPPVRVGRNKPCPCGSGRKYRKCCGRGH